MDEGLRKQQTSGDSSTQKWTVCSCSHCYGRLEFDAVHAGTVIQCPHCRKETVLFIPQADSRPAPIVQSPPKIAKLVAQAGEKKTGVEAKLELTSSTFSK